MDHTASRFKDLELGLENGVPISEENRVSLSQNASNSGRVYAENLLSVTSMNVEGHENKDGKEHKVVKEKRKSLGNKKPAKPPRAPRAPSLDAADQKLIREIAELARLRRARIERIKVLKKSKAVKPTSSSNNMFVMVFTVIFLSCHSVSRNVSWRYAGKLSRISFASRHSPVLRESICKRSNSTEF